MKSIGLSKPSIAIMAVLCLMVAVLGFGLIPRPASANISSYEWLGAAYTGNQDPYFSGSSIVAYREGDTAKLVAKVANTTGAEISIDYSRLTLGWTTVQEEADSGPKTIAKDAYGIFEWVFDVPSVGTASNLVMHNYGITVQYDVWGGEADRKWSVDGSNFVIYVDAQVSCRDSVNKWTANNDAYMLWGYEGRQIMTEALYLYNKAEDQYAAGNFAEASTSYTDAVTKQLEAIEKDSNSALTGESALTLAGTGGTKGTGYLIAGIGILIAGIGVMGGALLWAIKGGKKPA